LKREYVQVGNSIQISKPGSRSTNSLYATNPWESSKENPIAIFYGPLVFAIPNHEKNM